MNLIYLKRTLNIKDMGKGWIFTILCMYRDNHIPLTNTNELPPAFIMQIFPQCDMSSQRVTVLEWQEA